MNINTTFPTTAENFAYHDLRNKVGAEAFLPGCNVEEARKHYAQLLRAFDAASSFWAKRLIAEESLAKLTRFSDLELTIHEHEVTA